MPSGFEPSREHPSTYFVQDRSSQEELERLRVQDELLTRSMGGVLPEQPDATGYQRVLDVGCGTGGWLIEAAKTYPTMGRLVGVDISPRMLASARQHAQVERVADRVQFQAMDALRMLEFPTGTFDLVNQRLGLSYLRKWDWPKLLREVQRVTRAGGVVRLTESDIATSSSPAFSRLCRCAQEAFFQAGHFVSPTHDGITNVLASLLEQAGLQQIQTRSYVLDYRAGTPEGAAFVADMQSGMRTLAPFLRKWTRLPDEYETLCQQALAELQQPETVTTLRLLTAWGRVDEHRGAGL